MELVFHKENGLYITEFEVTSDFNVHLERSKGGKVSFYQKTTDGNYDHIEKLSKNIDKVFDYDFQALVYPKVIKITSECEFDVASLTTDGEVTEIKSQSKEVEITANGVTEIAPDAGFGYLSGVKVNVNVPQSGSSGGGVGGYINDMLTEFYSIDWARAEELGYDASLNSGFSSAIKSIVCYFILSKGSAMGMNILMNTPFFFADSSLLSLIEAGGFCPIKIIDWGVEKVYNTFDDIIASFKGEYDFSGIFTRITKEEFYNLEA